MIINYNNIAIIGKGVVGTQMHNLFSNAIIYDKDKGIGSLEEANKADIAFICVPTPKKQDGSCDTTIVEEVMTKLTNVKLFIIRSTVYVGFTDKMAEKLNKLVVFQPEYLGETASHPFIDMTQRNWISLGGSLEATEHASIVYQGVYNSNIRILQYPAKEVEVAKYMENSFFACKVIFCNEFYDICKSMGINYNIARDVWTMDPRIGTSHTFVYPEKRGYDGKCLPKDIASIVKQAKENGVDCTLLDSIIEKNYKYSQNN